MEEDNLFVPKAVCGGSPAAIYAGRLISPPPPAIESMVEAKKQRTARIKKDSKDKSPISDKKAVITFPSKKSNIFHYSRKIFFIHTILFQKNRKKESDSMKSYVLANEKLKITILSYGAIIQKIEMPDQNGNWQNIVLGFEDKEEYKTKNLPYFGAVVGRTAGRTENGILKIGEKEYLLEKNANGKHSIHGGSKNLSNQEWLGIQEGNVLLCKIKSPHLENGYPGEAEIEVKYSLEGDSLHIEYFAKATEDTYFNLTNHTYFSLSGNPEEEIGKQYLTLRAKEYMEVNKDTIPTKIASVEKTIFDFQKAKALESVFNSDAEQVKIVGGGIDHPFLTDYALLEDRDSGRAVEVTTENQAIVIYTANWLHEIGRKNHTGICFEAQDLPSLVKFKSEEYKIGKTYRRKTSFRFFHID